MQKRGQVTLFVIVGIIVVLGIVLFTNFRYEIVDFFGDLTQGETVIAEQLQPVQNHIQSCLEDVTLEGVDLLASQGGYINFPEDKYENDRRNKFSNVLNVFPGVDVAYWFYEDVSGNQISQIPTIQIMEEELEEYIAESFEKCVSTSDLYRSQGYDIEFSEGGRTNVDIGKENVRVEFRRKVTAEYKGVGDSWSKHEVDVSVPLGNVYESAIDVMNKENKELWLENATMNYVLLYGLPHSNVEFTCSPKIWNKKEIASDLQKYLAVNVPFYKVKDSDYDSYYYEEPLSVWDLNKQYQDTKFIFEYNSEWPFELDIDPSQGDSVISRPLPGEIPFMEFCVNYENFFYDIKYPILMTVKKEDLEFKFANLVVIRRDKPRRPMSEEKANYVDYCESGGREIDVSVLAYEDNTDTAVSLGDADVFFNCVKFNCYIGKTSSNGRLREEFPVCGNGEIEIMKEGYSGKTATLTTFNDGPSSVGLILKKINILNYSVEVLDEVDGSLSAPRKLMGDEVVLLEVARFNEDKVEQGFAGIYPDDETQIELVADVYKVKATLIKETPITMPEKKIEKCKCPEVLGLCLCGKEEIVIPATNLDSAMLGGAQFTWTINRADLNSDEIVFYVINKGVPNTYEKLSENFDLGKVMIGHISEVKPKFK